MVSSSIQNINQKSYLQSKYVPVPSNGKIKNLSKKVKEKYTDTKKQLKKSDSKTTKKADKQSINKKKTTEKLPKSMSKQTKIPEKASTKSLDYNVNQGWETSSMEPISEDKNNISTSSSSVYETKNPRKSQMPMRVSLAHKDPSGHDVLTNIITSSISLQEKANQKRPSKFQSIVRKTKVLLKEAITGEPVYSDEDWMEKEFREAEIEMLKERKIKEFRKSVKRQSVANPSIAQNQEDLVESFRKAPLRITTEEQKQIEANVAITMETTSEDSENDENGSFVEEDSSCTIVLSEALEEQLSIDSSESIKSIIIDKKKKQKFNTDHNEKYSVTHSTSHYDDTAVHFKGDPKKENKDHRKFRKSLYQPPVASSTDTSDESIMEEKVKNVKNKNLKCGNIETQTSQLQMMTTKKILESIKAFQQKQLNSKIKQLTEEQDALNSISVTENNEDIGEDRSIVLEQQTNKLPITDNESIITDTITLPCNFDQGIQVDLINFDSNKFQTNAQLMETDVQNVTNYEPMAKTLSQMTINQQEQPRIGSLLNLLLDSPDVEWPKIQDPEPIQTPRIDTNLMESFDKLWSDVIMTPQEFLNLDYNRHSIGIELRKSVKVIGGIVDQIKICNYMKNQVAVNKQVIKNQNDLIEEKPSELETFALIDSLIDDQTFDNFDEKMPFNNDDELTKDQKKDLENVQNIIAKYPDLVNITCKSCTCNILAKDLVVDALEKSISEF